MSEYLFVHFTGEDETGEQIYFAESNDGLHWKDRSLQPSLVNTLGTKGVRDPFLVRNGKTGKYYLIATDLRIANGWGWKVAKHEGSKDLIVWESDDLVHFDKIRAVSPFPKSINYKVGCVWAPEAVYLKDKDCFFVFWSTMSQFEGQNESKQRIFACYTEDFVTFTEPFVYMEDTDQRIDLTIIETADGYHRFIKDETHKTIIHDFVENIEDSKGTVIHDEVLESFTGVEGPEIYQLSNGSYCLIIDRYAQQKGYLPLICSDLMEGHFTVCNEEDFDFGQLTKRHGGVIKV